MAYLKDVFTTYKDEALDAFGRLPVANPQTLFDAQLTYDLQPLLYEEVKSGSGADVTHDSTNRRAAITFSSTPTGNVCYLQSYEFFRYQPGKSQEIFMTFNFGAAVANVRCFAGYLDVLNDIGFSFQQAESGGTLSFNISSGTGAGGQQVNQSSWNLDKLDGTGRSEITLDVTKDNILFIDFQALYVGRVRFGFVIDGVRILAHEFLNANAFSTPYIETANLPIAVGMVSNGGTVTKTMYFNCCSVISNGGVDETVGYEFATPDTSVTAGNGTATHLISIRPKTTFNSFVNRVKFASLEVDLLVTGNSPVFWQLCIGQSFSVAPTWTDINATYSAFQYGTGGTLSGSPAIVIDSGYVPASASTKGANQMKITDRYPITLDYNGAVRSLGTLTLLVTGVGASSATRASLKHKEIR